MENTFYTDVSKWGNNILFRGYKDGQRVSQKVKFEPTLFVPVQKETEYKSLLGQYVTPLQFDTIKECKQALDESKEIANLDYYGQDDIALQFIEKYFGSDVPFDIDLINITSIDIEVYSTEGFPRADEAAYPVSAIALQSTTDSVIHVWGTKPYDPKKTILEGNLHIVYHRYESEYDLLCSFVDYWERNCPDIVTGWNTRFFDIPYLVNRIHNVIGDSTAKRLSPWKAILPREVTNKKLKVFEVYGIQQLDYLDLFRKFAYAYGQLESYKLDFVASVVLGEKKVDYSEYGSLHSLYEDNHQLFIDYNIKDTLLITRFEEKMGLINLCLTVAYKAGSNMNDAFGSVKVWDALINNELMKKNIVIPPKKDNTKLSKIQGAYVKDPQCGFHDWVCSFDLNSLYPHIMMQYNLSPETYVQSRVDGVTVDRLLNKEDFQFSDDYAMTARGNLFRKDVRGVLPSLVDELYTQRSTTKKEMLKREQDLQNLESNDPRERYLIEKDINRLTNEQMAIKILMNSLYGATSNEYFRYYSTHIAESITLSGQLAIRWAEKKINSYLNKTLKTDRDYIIAIDTDSLYVSMGELVKITNPKDPVAYLDKVCAQIFEPLLTEGYEQLSQYMNAYEQKMVMKREVIADRGVWTGKKHYALNVHNSEGVQYAEPKIKIMGIEAVKSSTPQHSRDLIKEAINLILTKDIKVVRDYVMQCKRDFLKLPVEDIAFPRGISNLDKFKGSSHWYGSGTPIHVRGAIVYNTLLEKLEVEHLYERIYEGDKIKFIYLLTPNNINENVISFKDVLPKEFKVEGFVDYETQFNKTFIEPINNILKHVGWSLDTSRTLEDLFA